MELPMHVIFIILAVAIFLFPVLYTVRRRLNSPSLSGEQPWLKNPEWAKGTIKDQSMKEGFFLLGFALFWNLFIAGILFAILQSDNVELPVMIFLGLFILIGLGMLIAGLRKFLQWYKYRGTRFVMAEVPGVIGGSLGGVIEIPHPVQATHGFTATLESIKREVVQSGKNTRVRETVRWSDSRHVRSDALNCSRRLTAIPVLFDIPYEAEATADLGRGKRWIWRLRLEAKTPGLNLKSMFEVPVFRTEHSPQKSVKVTADTLLEDSLTLQSRLAAIGIHQTHTLGNDTLLAFPLSRLWFCYVCFPPLALLVGTMGGVAHYLGAPLLFPIVFGGFGLLILIGSVACIRSVHLRITDDTLDIRSRRWGWVSRRRLPKDSIQTISARSWLSINNIPQYDLLLKLNNGSTVRLPTTIANRENTRAATLHLAQLLHCQAGEISEPLMKSNSL